ncbi:MAG: hypothetical protein AWU57_628, partial [Marinobacter sp. T13-3]
KDCINKQHQRQAALTSDSFGELSRRMRRHIVQKTLNMLSDTDNDRMSKETEAQAKARLGKLEEAMEADADPKGR